MATNINKLEKTTSSKIHNRRLQIKRRIGPSYTEQPRTTDLQTRSTRQQLFFLYIVVVGLIPATDPEDYLKKKTCLQKSILTKKIENCQSTY